MGALSDELDRIQAGAGLVDPMIAASRKRQRDYYASDDEEVGQEAALEHAWSEFQSSYPGYGEADARRVVQELASEGLTFDVRTKAGAAKLAHAVGIRLSRGW